MHVDFFVCLLIFFLFTSIKNLIVIMKCDSAIMSVQKRDSLIGIGKMSVCFTNEVFNGRKPLNQQKLRSRFCN